MRKRAIITLHGIRTRGEWQKSLTPTLARYDLEPYPLDFGYFSALRLLCPRSRERIIDWFHREYDDICKIAQVKRPSIVAHSFGTYMTGWLLEKYPQTVIFDKVILTGSILPTKFDWPKIFEREQVLAVHNEVATRDIWPGVAKRFVDGAGDSGSNGFNNCKGLELKLTQDTSDIKHAGTFFDGHYEEWGRFLTSPRWFSSKELKIIRELLEMAANRARDELSIPKNKVRANIFLPIDEVLKIPDGAFHNMDGDPDITISAPIGRGSTGLAFQNRRIYKTVLQPNQSWVATDGNMSLLEGADLPEEEQRKAHPDLKWILSFPMMSPDDGRVFGVMGVDGLVDCDLTLSPKLSERAQKLLEELEKRHVPAMVRKLHNKLETGGF